VLKAVRTYASLVKFGHTVFAMPFALIGYFYGVRQAGFDGLLLLKVVLCMVFARNAAMGFNRWADRRIDAANPRTAHREIPRGVVAPNRALAFVIGNAVLFVACAGWINPLCLRLSPAALAVILGYSLTKRFTSLSHLVLGLALAIAPAGAYIAATGTLDVAPVLLSGLVLTWTGGFDIIYSLQDAAFDRQNRLHSLPARLGVRGALWVSAGLHAATLILVLVLDGWWGGGGFARTGAALFIALLVYQHLIVGPGRLERVDLAFSTLNGVASIVYALGVLLELGITNQAFL
jgi:4-hydroxybenzoate polyprenyltransferase